MSQPGAVRGVRAFVAVWFGQLVSLLGSGISAFALGVWVYQQTGSATQYALLGTFTTLPSILFLPLAGALVDRSDRRSVMLLSDLGAGLSQLAIAALYFTGQLQVWHIYVAVLLTSTCSAFQWAAFSATTSLLVPKQHLGRASGMIQTADAVSRIASPTLAGILIATIALSGVLLIDTVTFLVSFAILLLVRFPQPPAVGSTTRRSIWRDAVYGWRYIADRPGLLALLLLFALVNFSTGIVTVLVVPMVLAFTNATVLGSILSTAGLGLLSGSLLMSVWGGPRRRMHAILGFKLLTAFSLVLVGIHPTIPIFYVSAFCFFLSVPFVTGASQAIWQVKVPSAVQGRVFAMRRVIAWSTLPLAYIVAGPLADRVFGPMLLPGGLLADSVGRIIGVGPGYGIALLFLVMGMIILLITIASYAYPRLRLVEDELPDAIGEVEQRPDQVTTSDSPTTGAPASA